MERHRSSLREEWLPGSFPTVWQSCFSTVERRAFRPLAQRNQFWPVSSFTTSRCSFEPELFAVGVGLWTAVWLFLNNFMFILMRQDRSLLYLFGTCAAVTVGYVLGLVFPRI